MAAKFTIPNIFSHGNLGQALIKMKAKTIKPSLVRLW